MLRSLCRWRKLEICILALALSIFSMAAAVPYTYVGGPVAVGAAGNAVNPVLAAGLDSGNLVRNEQVCSSYQLLTSAARTATATSTGFINYSNRGLMVNLNVTAASGTGGLTVNVQYADQILSNFANVFSATLPVTAVGYSQYCLYPGVASTGSGFTQTLGIPLGAVWRVQVTVGDASSYTYQVAGVPLR